MPRTRLYPTTGLVAAPVLVCALINPEVFRHQAGKLIDRRGASALDVLARIRDHGRGFRGRAADVSARHHHLIELRGGGSSLPPVAGSVAFSSPPAVRAAPTP